MFSSYLCDKCKEKSPLIEVKDNKVDLDEKMSELICQRCYNEISAELIRRKVSSLNIPDVEEPRINLPRLERNMPYGVFFHGSDLL